MNLSNAYRITLYDNGNHPYVQFIEAENVDNAIALAKTSFQARLYGLAERNKSSESQKACTKSVESERLLFGFNSGHVTIEGGKAIDVMLLEAQNHPFVEGGSINEITSELYYR